MDESAGAVLTDPDGWLKERGLGILIYQAGSSPEEGGKRRVWLDGPVGSAGTGMAPKTIDE